MGIVQARPDLTTYPSICLTCRGCRNSHGPTKAKAIIVNSPSNPKGTVFPESVVHGLVDIAARNDMRLISNECYKRIVFEGEHFSPARFDDDGRVLSVFSLSKTYAMPGWRVGYLCGASEVVDQIARPGSRASSKAPQNIVGDLFNVWVALR